MKIEIEIKDNDIVDIIVGALEGGSNYWYNIPHLDMITRRPNMSMSESIAWDALNGKTIPVYDIDEWDSETDEYGESIGGLSYFSIKEGLEMYASDGGSLDFENMDAGDYDTIFQWMVLGEIIYG